MKRSMFMQVLTVSLMVIFACVIVTYSLTYVRMRDEKIAARIDTLKMLARDVADLASRLRTDGFFYSGMQESLTRELLYEKTSTIYNEYNAFTLIISSQGRSYTYYSEETLSDESVKYLPDQDTLSTYLQRAVQGEETSLQTNSAMGPLFTVIIPWNESSYLTGEKSVVGIVMIQTAAQNIQAVYEGLGWQLILAALGVFALAGVVIFFLTRRLTMPLTAMADAAERLSKGDFEAKAPVAGSRETMELGMAFNHMAGQLERIEKNRRDFLANVSHELRSPITSIQGYAQGMLDGAVPEDGRENALKVIVGETKRLSRLINGLLDLSRMEDGQVSLNMTEFDINELVRTVIIQKLPNIEEKDLDVMPLFEDRREMVRADREQIQQVVINLIDNAVKYTPPGGKIRIDSAADGDIVRLTVRDDGIGIPPEDQPYIFDRFYKTDKAHTVGKGTGLGLAICKAIMDRHGQTIRLVSGDGGCEFEITLERAGK